MTAFETGAPKKRSALRRSCWSTYAETSGGVRDAIADAEPDDVCSGLLGGLVGGCRVAAFQAKGEEGELVADLGDAAAHEPLGGVDGVSRLAQKGAACCIAHENTARGRKGHDTGHQPIAVFAGDDDRRVALHERHKGVRCS